MECTSGADCADGMICVDSRCELTPDGGAAPDAGGCPTGTTSCAGACVDLQTSNTNCGGCDNVCGSGESCVAGTCTFVCPGTQLLCGGGCVDAETSDVHCGSCGNACAPGTACTAGSCASICAPTETYCDGSCVDTSSDAAHCGACGSACAAGGACQSGSCRYPAGTPCSFAGECMSDFCVDGVCCNTACAGDCGVCNSPGSVGTCVGSNAACASGCGYCAPAADAFVCTCDLVYGAHSQVQCGAAGGEVVSAAGVSFCRFAAAACPAGWTSYLGWSTTSAATGTYGNETTVDASSTGACCGQQECGPAVTAICSSGGHAWSANATVESATCVGIQTTGRRGFGSCDNGTCSGTSACTGGTSITVTATRTQIGCY